MKRAVAAAPDFGAPLLIMELRVLEGEAERGVVVESGEQLPEYLGWLRLGDDVLLLYSVEEVTTPDERGGAVLAENVYLELK